MIILTERDNSRLIGVHKDLVKVVRRAAELGAQPFMVLEGLRSREQAEINYTKGRTAAEIAAAGIRRPPLPGPKVTWTTNSPHCMQADGYGHAVDLLPIPVDWSLKPLNLARFDAVAKAMFAAAKELGVTIRWGADWDRDGNPRERGESDSPHWELHK